MKVGLDDVHPRGIEPRLSAPQADVLSVERRVRDVNVSATYAPPYPLLAHLLFPHLQPKIL